MSSYCLTFKPSNMLATKTVGAVIIYYAVFCTFSTDTRMIFISTNVSEEKCNHKYSECFPLSNLYPENIDLSSNTTIVFLGGVHFLRSNIEFRDVKDLKLLFNLNSQLHCDERAGIIIVNVTNLYIYRLAMTNCGAEISQHLAEEALYIQTETVLKIEIGLQAAIFAVNIRNLHLDNTKINGSHGYGFLAINIIGDSLVSGTLINSSNTNSLNDYCMIPRLTPSQAAKCFGGNALFVYNDFPGCPTTKTYHKLTVTDSTFSHGLNPTSGFQNYISRGTGLGVIVSQKYYDVHVKLCNSTFTNNVAKSFGSNIYIRIIITETNSSVVVHNSDITFGKSNSHGGPESALVFLHGLYQTSLGNYKNCSNILSTSAIPSKEERHREILVIEDSKFYGNFGGTICAVSFTSLLHVYHIYTVLIRNCTFSKNTAIRASALLVSEFSSENTQLLEMTVENTVIEYHTTLTDLYAGTQSNINSIISVVKFTFRNCTFVNNNNSVLFLYDSNVYFEGKTIFRNNTARYGGALYITGNSIIYLRPNAEIIFDNNSVHRRGGAIYITGGSEVAFFFNCRVQVFDPSYMEVSKLNVTMRFINNTALESGDVLYGGRIDSCFALAPSQFLYLNETLNGNVMFDSITDITDQPRSTTLIASDAIKLCFCIQGTHDCSIKNLTISRYPGEEFNVSVIGIGQRDGTVPAVVRAQQTQHNHISYRKTRSSCTNITYKVTSLQTPSHEQLHLNANNVKGNSSRSLTVNVNLTDCSTLVAFSYNQDEGICKCDPRLKVRNIICNINKRIIVRQPPYWLGNYSNYLLLHDNCPYDYCRTTAVEITMTEPNISEQCAFDRYGTLCGSCREGFSHVFGSSRCLKCSNTHLLLIIPFALGGIVLVAFLFALNLTVSVGTINGLIFYANIVKINETTFFPPGYRSLFRVLISWLNLDLGIETCFYNGMHSLGKSWLQFTFPFYLWVIVAFTIVLFRHSTKLTRLCGNNSVSVLATIFLLSFTKLQQTVIKAMSFTTLQYPNGFRLVWLYDGNVQYAKNGHLALILFSLVFLLSVGAPYAMLILVVQFLRQYSGKWFLQWVNKLMPIFDAYLGPYKPRQGYWTGLLLFIRVALVAILTINVSGNPAIDIFVVSVIALFLILLNLGQGGVYKHTFLTYLEISYIVNLGMLAAATALVRQIDGLQRPAIIYTSTATALVTFTGILVYHTKVQITKKYKQWRNANFGQATKDLMYCCQQTDHHHRC